MTATNKAFAYVFNTSNEDQKVARVLSGWPAGATVVAPSLEIFDAATKKELARMQAVLFASCIGMQDNKYNINNEVVTLLMVYLTRSYPMLKALCASAPLVKRIDTVAKQVGVNIEAFVAWGTLLRNCKVQASEAVSMSTMNSFAEQQTDMIQVLTEQNKRLMDRIQDVEATLAASASTAGQSVGTMPLAKGAKRDASVPESDVVPAKKSRGEAIMPSTLWFEWFTLVPRPWNQGNDGNRQRRSDMKLLVDFMRLFIEGGYSLDENKDGYRDEVLKLGKSAEMKLGLYLKEKGIKAKAGGACLKKLRELHCAGHLDAHIQRFDALFRAGLVEDPSPLSSINQLRQLQLNASI
ncbi:hypothetical protein AaE_012305 [Aphanomyces astaci]|uniref:Uncharacterized protein n=1 Tax=Aphanomyces astaci TaxID=112090 RepID=A0A6A4ZHK5_APHAT|nr:hypothetical protein AaE_012305 [Aphanomyces astaci]